LAAEFQEPTRMLCDLPWSSWRGCYVILHIKPLDFGRIRAHIIIVYFDDLVSSALLCWDDVVSSEII
jgi:hypothetical protein